MEISRQLEDGEARGYKSNDVVVDENDDCIKRGKVAPRSQPLTIHADLQFVVSDQQIFRRT